jgi:hypothetical protein
MTTKLTDEQRKAIEAHDDECRTMLRELIEDGIRSGEIPAERAFADLRASANVVKQT